MGSKTIIQITETQTTLNDTDYIEIQESAGTSKKTTFAYIKTWILTWIYGYIYPVGNFYVQYPDKKLTVGAIATAQNVTDYPSLTLGVAITDGDVFPTSARPATMFGGTWVEQFNTDATFFRTGGTDGQTRTDGLSADQFESHEHGIYSLNAGAGTMYNGFGAGTRHTLVALAGAGSISAPIGDGINALRTGAKTEPINRLMKLWKRTVL